ncbi:eukaryotic translation initiation factor 2-alpha kinase 1-like [Chironomus tepperi]|uniref:eukaryotic translation initiation factor 2-alpha kinase 1-like n=1 Tax=Chironomus tepperi TaxID=113505 RepID=UPI00391F8872
MTSSSDSSSDNEPIDDSWSNLRTNKKFDEETNKQVLVRRKSSSTGIDEIDTGKTVFLDVLTPSTPYSLLVQSLIKQLCNFIEGNKNKSNDLYKKICLKLHELKMIDESYMIGEFENIRSSYETAITALVKVARENSLPINNIVEFPLNGEPQHALEWSRYYKDFEEIEKIAHGGFADVFKARHKLDNHIYAIKKILIKSTSVKNILPHLKEVKTFASLNHFNVVPYKSCWLEPLITYETEKRVTHEDESWETRNESANIRITQSNDSLRLQTNNNESFSINFEYSENHQSEKSILSSIPTNNDSYNDLQKLRRLELSNCSSESKFLVPHVKLAWSVLFIQMKLCEKTLRNFLDERNECENFKTYYESFNLNEDNMTSIALSIFQQICNGLEYIHNRSIVHHDLKPGNVFVSFDNSTLLFQLGDFGLSCPLDSNEMVSHYGFGTRLYAAKEQLEGRICSKKSDIYSLGVILIELLLRCKTFMECSNKVNSLKKGEKVLEIEPNLCLLITRLLSNRTDLRPEITEIKNKISHYIDNASTEVVRLKNIIEEKDAKICELMEEIKTLKKQLSK